MSGFSSQTRCFFVDSTCDVGSAPARDVELGSPLLRGEVHGEACRLQCGQVVCQRMLSLALLQSHFVFAAKFVCSPDRLSENEVF